MDLHFCVREVTDWSAGRRSGFLDWESLLDRERMLDAWLRISIWALISAIEIVRSFSAASAASSTGSFLSGVQRVGRLAVWLVESRDFLIGVERTTDLLEGALEVAVLRGERNGLERVEAASILLFFAGVGPDMMVVWFVLRLVTWPCSVCGSSSETNESRVREDAPYHDVILSLSTTVDEESTGQIEYM